MNARPTQPTTPLTDAWFAVAGGGQADWNDDASPERYSVAHAALARWFGPNATEIAPLEVEPLRAEYDAVTAYLDADQAWEANPAGVPLVLAETPIPATVVPQETHDAVHAAVAALAAATPVEQHGWLWTIAHAFHLI